MPRRETNRGGASRMPGRERERGREGEREREREEGCMREGAELWLR
jgi:hypothetical protein